MFSLDRAHTNKRQGPPDELQRLKIPDTIKLKCKPFFVFLDLRIPIETVSRLISKVANLRFYQPIYGGRMVLRVYRVLCVIWWGI